MKMPFVKHSWLIVCAALFARGTHAADCRELLNCPGIVSANNFFDSLYTRWGALGGVDADFPPYTHIIPSFVPADETFEPQVDQTQISWSAQNGFQGARSRVGTGFTFDYFHNAEIYDMGVSVVGPVLPRASEE
jgi:hypothetical protein